MFATIPSLPCCCSHGVFRSNGLSGILAGDDARDETPIHTSFNPNIDDPRTTASRSVVESIIKPIGKPKGQDKNEGKNIDYFGKNMMRTTTRVDARINLRVGSWWQKGQNTTTNAAMVVAESNGLDGITIENRADVFIASVTLRCVRKATRFIHSI